MIQPYNYLLDTCRLNRNIRYPVSRRSELKKVYEEIVNLSRRTPFCMIDISRENQDYTFGIKEAALLLKSRIAGMADLNGSDFSGKAVVVSDDNILKASLLQDDTDSLPEVLEFKVNTLANVQINHGRELLDTSRGLPQGEYRFIARVGEEIYPLTYVQEARVENKAALEQIADFLNEHLTMINAVVDKGSSRDYSRLMIVSELSGKFGEKRFYFEDMGTDREGVAEFFGMNRMVTAPNCASFDLNGIPKQTATNTFTLENILRISLNQSSEKPVSVKITPDRERVLASVDSFLSVYNNIIRIAKDWTLDNKEHYRAGKLINEMKNLTNLYSEELKACGMTETEEGMLELEEPAASRAALDGSMEKLFARNDGFIARLEDKASAIAINPLEYLDKIIVTYPDTDKNSFCNPYITSMYSGLFFNSYC